VPLHADVPASPSTPTVPTSPPPVEVPPEKKPHPHDCGDRRICAGPVVITLPGNGQHGASVEIDLPGLPITIAIGPQLADDEGAAGGRP
jgi:hypothetical protein